MTKLGTWSFAFVFAIASGPLAAAAAHPEVLVVYNATSADSVAVARYYAAKRQIPSTNLCAISPPANDIISLPAYTDSVKAPVQACLNAVGANSILYIVFSYLTPYALSGAPPYTAAVDSYVADIWDAYQPRPWTYGPTHVHGYYGDSQNQGNVYASFQPLAAYRASPNAALIYSVWRLDGATAAVATGLVDLAMEAEGQGGPSGQGCFDLQYGPAASQPDWGANSGDWDIHAAAVLLGQAGIPVTEDDHSQEFGTAPAPLSCPDTAFYTGWYSYNNYNNAFTWQPGAIGWHLDSASALNPRGGANWSANALLSGITVTTGSVAEPFLQGLVRPAGTFRNLLAGAAVGDAFLRNTRWLKWDILYIGDPLYRPFAGGRSPFNPPPVANGLWLSPAELVGGASATGTVIASSPAPPGGFVFSLSSADPGTVSLPSTVKIPAGRNYASFGITTSPVAQAAPVVVTATASGVTLSNTLGADPLLGQLWSASANSSAGVPVAVTVILNGPAPAGGARIALSSSNPLLAAAPPSVTVPAGAYGTTFAVSTQPVGTQAQVTITATYAGAAQQWNLALLPAIGQVGLGNTPVRAGQGNGVSVLLATPAPPGGATVHFASSNPGVMAVPATLVIPQGSTYGAVQFTPAAGSTGKSIQLAIWYGGDVQMLSFGIE